MLRLLVILVLLTTTISCDQVSKAIVRRNIRPEQQISLAGDHVTLLKLENTGSFLSFGDQWPPVIKLIVLTIFPVLVLVVGLFMLITKTTITRPNVLAFSLIIGGGIGNLYDRIVHGSVTDFIHLRFGFLQTGVFNLADVAIMTGMCILIIHTYLNQRKQKQLA